MITKDNNARLAKIPSASRAAIKELLALNHISGQDLNNILDAVFYAELPQYALAFCVSYSHLKDNRIDVADTVMMAKELGKPINLRWSKSKWSNMHSRLSEAMTMKSLSGESVDYDIQIYSEALPDKWRGYIIKTSRRLGCEGFRQHHCVASYHKLIMDGYCAFAVVFVDKVRWTVMLRMSAGGEVFISDMKSSYNQTATSDIRERIHGELGIAVACNSFRNADDSESDDAFIRDCMTEILPILDRHGVDKVSATFDGYGDSGTIESPCFFINGKMQEINFLTDTMIEVNVVNSVYDKGVYENQVSKVSMSVCSAVEDMIDRIVMSTGVDWYNDDGGSGCFSLHVPDRAYDLSIDTRYTESENAFDVKSMSLDGL